MPPPGPGRERADRLVVDAGLAPSRERARALILAGRVQAAGRRVEKAGQMLAQDVELSLVGEPVPYVSRGGVKLAHALERFGVDVAGRRCLDAGSSTGGFTDCLLQRGAASVTCVDVGRGQLDWGLRNDPRVRVLEGVNARHLEPEAVGPPPSIVTADLAFISLSVVLPALCACAPGAELILLVKPQFEAGRGAVGKGGVVRDPAQWLSAMERVAAALAGLGWEVRAATASPLPGPAGNREFFLHALPASGPASGPGTADRAMLEAAVAEALEAGVPSVRQEEAP